MNKKPHVLIAPLNWGLGHATRCIPIIRYLLSKNVLVSLASDGRAGQLLQKEFPSLPYFPLNSSEIIYPKNGKMLQNMMWQGPKILKNIYKEHHQLQKIIKKHHISAVISDNRYGMWSKKISSVFITHQLNILMPDGQNLLQKSVNQVNHFFIKNYDECWVPDWDGEQSLSGKLSEVDKNCGFLVKHLGILSRMKKRDVEKKYDILVLLSGPEPQRTLLEQKILAQILDFPNKKILVIRGITEANKTQKFSENITIIDHLTSETLNQKILESEIIVARSGYSTVMDLEVLDKKAVYIPTPGQTEQEYLAKRLYKQKKALFSNQNSFSLKNILKQNVHFLKKNNIIKQNNDFHLTIDSLLEQL